MNEDDVLKKFSLPTQCFVFSEQFRDLAVAFVAITMIAKSVDAFSRLCDYRSRMDSCLDNVKKCGLFENIFILPTLQWDFIQTSIHEAYVTYASRPEDPEELKAKSARSLAMFHATLCRTLADEFRFSAAAT